MCITLSDLNVSFGQFFFLSDAELVWSKKAVFGDPFILAGLKGLYNDAW
jgi:hypothetical protein